jgi:hypothetical protein
MTFTIEVTDKATYYRAVITKDHYGVLSHLAVETDRFPEDDTQERRFALSKLYAQLALELRREQFPGHTLIFDAVEQPDGKVLYVNPRYPDET